VLAATAATLAVLPVAEMLAAMAVGLPVAEIPVGLLAAAQRQMPVLAAELLAVERVRVRVLVPGLVPVRVPERVLEQLPEQQQRRQRPEQQQLAPERVPVEQVPVEQVPVEQVPGRVLAPEPVALLAVSRDIRHRGNLPSQSFFV